MFSQCKVEEGGGEKKTRRGGKRTLASGRAWVLQSIPSQNAAEGASQRAEAAADTSLLGKAVRAGHLGGLLERNGSHGGHPASGLERRVGTVWAPSGTSPGDPSSKGEQRGNLPSQGLRRTKGCCFDLEPQRCHGSSLDKI